MALQVLIESCKTLLAHDDFWLAAGITNQSYEEGTRNASFKKSVDAFEDTGASAKLLKELRAGINGNLTAILNTSPSLTELATQKKSHGHDIRFCTAEREAIVEIKLLYDTANTDQFHTAVPKDADKLNSVRAAGRSLFQVVFFVQMPRYSYPTGEWYKGGKWAKARQVQPHRGIATQFSMLEPHMPSAPVWPGAPPYIRELRFPGVEVDAHFLRRWFEFVFAPDTDWAFDAHEHLRDAAVGCAVWQY